MWNNLENVKQQYIIYGRLCNLITIQFNNDGWHKIVLVNESMNSLNNANSQILQFLMRHIILLNIDNILKTLHIYLFASIDRFDLVVLALALALATASATRNWDLYQGT